MATLGRACLLLALAISVYGIAASVYGARARERRWVDSGRRAVYALAGVLTVAFVILETAFLRSDFSFNVVASHSSTTTPAFYRATAAWSSQEGSLLLWVWLLSLWSSLILFVVRRRAREVQPWATAVLLGFAAFFAGLTFFMADPFAVSSPAPLEGAGLNPLLRHPSMMIHPPMLYSGYTLFTVPFAFAVGALIARKLDAEWSAVTRRFSLAAWFCLGVGILLGARWSYVELGWGGYWGWDPVENASLLPWLTGTAFLHSVMIQEKRGMLKVWNVSLVLATGILAILGTFLVRSGILDSIHAFGASTLGRPFLVLIAVLIAGSVALVISRRRELRSEHRLDTLWSREAIFLLNNLVLVGLAFVVFWGTFFPLISEAVTGTKASVGPPWFDRYTVPLALVLVLLSGIGPVIAWRRATLGNLWRGFRFPLVVLALVVGAGIALGAGDQPSALAMFGLAAFVLAAVAQEFWRGTRARSAMTSESPPVALVALVRRNRRRYGGYLVHAGMAVLFVGVAASSAFQANRDARLKPGQSVRVAGYDVKYVRPTTALEGEKISLGAVLDVRKDGKREAIIRPTRGYYPSTDPTLGPVARYFDGTATSEVGLRAGLRRDLWMAVEPDIQALEPFVREADRRFAGARPQLQAVLIAAIAERYRRQPLPATFRIIVSPLVTWIWIGALIVVFGALVAMWPAPAAVRRGEASAYARRLARELA
ncbi:MAG: cytochrome c-type biosis protein CcmF [Solirubrobacteraceae bacterium]|jgi:cytochrome c-type biogenesis protein CcmF|nr:cytochrome c-type biosis protein CcmF [Solirubrobacteraceae bacterium]